MAIYPRQRNAQVFSKPVTALLASMVANGILFRVKTRLFVKRDAIILINDNLDWITESGYELVNLDQGDLLPTSFNNKVIFRVGGNHYSGIYEEWYYNDRNLALVAKLRYSGC